MAKRRITTLPTKTEQHINTTQTSDEDDTELSVEIIRCASRRAYHLTNLHLIEPWVTKQRGLLWRQASMSADSPRGAPISTSGKMGNAGKDDG